MGRRSGYLWELRPYFRQVAGQLLIGSVGGFASNLAVVLPAVMLGRVIDAVLALDQGRGSADRAEFLQGQASAVEPGNTGGPLCYQHSKAQAGKRQTEGAAENAEG